MAAECNRVIKYEPIIIRSILYLNYPLTEISDLLITFVGNPTTFELVLFTVFN